MIFEHAYWYIALFLEALAMPNCTPLSDLTRTHVTDELRKRRLNALAAALILLENNDERDECVGYLRQPIETREGLLTLEHIENRLVYDALEKYDKQRRAPLFIPLFLAAAHRSHGCAASSATIHTRTQILDDVERFFFGYSDAAVAASATADAGGIEQRELRAYRNLLHMHPC